MPSAPQLVPLVELQIGGVWTDVTSYTDCRQSPISATRGRQDEQAALSPSKANLRFNNADGRFSPRNPNGPWYGSFGRNTPCRISLPTYGYRFHGEISEWPTTWDHSGRIAWTPVVASGITRRLSQGAPPLSGPLELWVDAQGASNVVGYWPMTDPVGSSSMASALSGGSAMVLEGTPRPRRAPTSDSAARGAIPVLNNGSFRAVPPGGTYSAFLLSVPAAGDTNDTTLYRVLTTGTVDRWEIRYFTAGTLQLRGFNGGVSVVTSAAIGALNGVPAFVRMHWYQSGGNVVWWLVLYNYATGAELATTSGSFAGTAGVANQVQFNSDRAAANIAVGQLVLMTTDQYPAIGAAYRGYAGETAGRRIERLCAAQSVPLVTVGNLDATELMGPQTAIPLLDLLAECEAADLGYLYEPREAFGLAYRTRESLYSQAAQASIPYTSLRSLEPVEDDQKTRNDVTVSRVRGSSARAVLSTGPLSVLSPPNGVGRYQDSVSLNLYADTQLETQAQWRLALGTIDEPRYPVIGADITAYAGALKLAASGIDVGDLLTVTSTPKWMPPGGADVLALGYTEVLGPHSWQVSWNCAPGTLYDNAFTLDDTARGRLDATTAVTTEALDTTETGIDYSTETLSGAVADVPYNIVIGGEEMTVTAATASLLTVTRSVNGVVKSHLTGQQIRLATPAYLAL
jgi:hypothetical protein